MRKKRKRNRRLKPQRNLELPPGTIVLHCGHEGVSRGTGWHWWKSSQPTEFRRPDGTEGRSSWTALCQPCVNAAGGLQNFKRVPISGELIWKAGESLPLTLDTGEEDPSLKDPPN